MTVLLHDGRVMDERSSSYMDDCLNTVADSEDIQLLDGGGVMIKLVVSVEKKKSFLKTNSFMDCLF